MLLVFFFSFLSRRLLIQHSILAEIDQQHQRAGDVPGGMDGREGSVAGGDLLGCPPQVNKLVDN